MQGFQWGRWRHLTLGGKTTRLRGLGTTRTGLCVVYWELDWGINRMLRLDDRAMAMQPPKKVRINSIRHGRPVAILIKRIPRFHAFQSTTPPLAARSACVVLFSSKSWSLIFLFSRYFSLAVFTRLASPLGHHPTYIHSSLPDLSHHAHRIIQLQYHPYPHSRTLSRERANPVGSLSLSPLFAC
jgi:hypothetical protein